MSPWGFLCLALLWCFFTGQDLEELEIQFSVFEFSLDYSTMILLFLHKRGLVSCIKQSLAEVNSLLSFLFFLVPVDFFNYIQVHYDFLFWNICLQSLDIWLILGLEHTLRTSALDGTRIIQLDQLFAFYSSSVHGYKMPVTRLRVGCLIWWNILTWFRIRNQKVNSVPYSVT